MNLADLLNVELYNDNLKMFNQTWDETLVENLYERQVRTSALMNHALTEYQHDMVLKKESRSHQKINDYGE